MERSRKTKEKANMIRIDSIDAARHGFKIELSPSDRVTPELF
jgi:hypothetical protein